MISHSDSAAKKTFTMIIDSHQLCISNLFSVTQCNPVSIDNPWKIVNAMENTFSVYYATGSFR